jgi:hypothetical protein
LNFHSVIFSSFHLDEITLIQAKINISIAEAKINTSINVITFCDTIAQKLSQTRIFPAVPSVKPSGSEFIKTLLLLLSFLTNTVVNISGIFIKSSQVRA